MSLSDQFYYLLRTQVEQDNRLQSEPEHFLSLHNPSIRRDGIPIDEDKRLFCLEMFIVESSQTGLPVQWLVQLKQSWQQIQYSY